MGMIARGLHASTFIWGIEGTAVCWVVTIAQVVETFEDHVARTVRRKREKCH
jgi:hypothetical protein